MRNRKDHNDMAGSCDGVGLIAGKLDASIGAS